MNSFDDLYCDLKADIAAVATPLFDTAEVFIRKRAGFVPQGTVLTSTGEKRIVVAAPPDFETRAVSPAEVLPLLHQALRNAATYESLLAVAVVEDVTITPAGQPPTRAIKVLVEHSRGLTVALYLPFTRRLLRGFTFGSTFAVPADPEVRVWPAEDAV